MSVRPAKTQISLGIRPVCSESSLCAQWVDKDLSFLHAQADLNLRWAHTHFVGFVMSRLKYQKQSSQIFGRGVRLKLPKPNHFYKRARLIYRSIFIILVKFNTQSLKITNLRPVIVSFAKKNTPIFIIWVEKKPTPYFPHIPSYHYIGSYQVPGVKRMGVLFKISKTHFRQYQVFYFPFERKQPILYPHVESSSLVIRIHNKSFRRKDAWSSAHFCQCPPSKWGLLG